MAAHIIQIIAVIDTGNGQFVTQMIPVGKVVEITIDQKPKTFSDEALATMLKDLEAKALAEVQQKADCIKCKAGVDHTVHG